MSIKFNDKIVRGTKLHDVNVPSVLRKRVKTGLSFFDDAYTGFNVEESKQGCTPSTVNFVTGDPGAGKTTMLLQLADKISQRGHIALYNSGEESQYQVKMTAERLRLKGQFYFTNHIMVDDLTDEMDHWKKTTGKQVFLIQDSLQTLFDGRYMRNGAPVSNGRTPIHCMKAITDACKKEYHIAFVVGHVGKDGNFKGDNMIKHMIDSHAELRIDNSPAHMSDTSGMRIFRLTKNRFGPSGIGYVLDMKPNGLSECGTTT